MFDECHSSLRQFYCYLLYEFCIPVAKQISCCLIFLSKICYICFKIYFGCSGLSVVPANVLYSYVRRTTELALMKANISPLLMSDQTCCYNVQTGNEHWNGGPDATPVRLG